MTVALAVNLKETSKRIQRVLSLNSYAIELCYSVLGPKVILPGFFGLIGIFFQIFAIGLVFSFMKNQALPGRATKILSFLHVDIIQLSFEQLAAVVSIIVLLLLIFSAIANFLHQKLSIVYACRVEQDVLSDLINKSQKFDLFVIEKIRGFSYKSIFSRVLFGDTRGLNRVLQMAMTTAIPVFSFVASGLFLVYLNWKLSLMMTPLIILYLIGIFFVNAKAIEASRKFDPINAETKKEALISILNRNKELSNELLSKPSYKDYFLSYHDIVIVAHRSSLVNDVFIALSLSLIFFGATRFSEGINKAFLAEMVLYLIALRYGVTFLKQFFGKFSTMNRFYPQITRLKHFQNFLNKENGKALSAPQEIVVNNEFTIQRGQPFLIKNDQPVDRFSAISLIHQLITSSRNLPQYRSIAMLTKDTYSAAAQNKSLETLIKAFSKAASSKDTHWLIIDQWVLTVLELKIDNFIKPFQNKFIVLLKVIDQQDVDQGRLLADFEDDQLKGIRPTMESDIFIASPLFADDGTDPNMVEDEVWD